MKHGYNAIIWGLFIVTFHINIGALPILPAFIGWINIIYGVNVILKDYHTKSFVKARNYAAFAFVITFASQVLIWLGHHDTYTQIISITYSLFNLLFVYYILDGSIHYLHSMGEMEHAKHYVGIQRAYIILHVLNTILACYAITITSQSLIVVAGAIGIILVISLMINIKTIKNIKISQKNEGIDVLI